MALSRQVLFDTGAARSVCPTTFRPDVPIESHCIRQRARELLISVWIEPHIRGKTPEAQDTCQTNAWLTICDNCVYVINVLYVLSYCMSIYVLCIVYVCFCSLYRMHCTAWSCIVLHCIVVHGILYGSLHLRTTPMRMLSDTHSLVCFSLTIVSKASRQS